MSHSVELYSKAVLDHGRHPRNRRMIADCSHSAKSDNPSCGDNLSVSLRIDKNGVICEAAFDGRSCVLATASASLMTELLVGKTPTQAKMLFRRFEALAAGDTGEFKDGMDVETAGMTILAGVNAYPARMKCATLAWKTMLAALENERNQQ
jgi:nitrogen fixation NifU-like protein